MVDDDDEDGEDDEEEIRLPEDDEDENDLFLCPFSRSRKIQYVEFSSAFNMDEIFFFSLLSKLPPNKLAKEVMGVEVEEGISEGEEVELEGMEWLALLPPRRSISRGCLHPSRD